MRLLKVAAAALMIVALALPSMADNKPGIGGMEPDSGESGCVDCTISPFTGQPECGGAPTAAGWMNCKGGWVYQCDATGSCDRYADCGQRCAYA